MAISTSRAVNINLQARSSRVRSKVQGVACSEGYSHVCVCVCVCVRACVWYVIRRYFNTEIALNDESDGVVVVVVFVVVVFVCFSGVGKGFYNQQ